MLLGATGIGERLAGVGINNKAARIKAGMTAAHMSIVALRKSLEAAGVEFIDENGGGLSVRL